MSNAADDAILTQALTAFGITKFRVVAVDLIWTMSGMTVGEGPALVGLSNSNLNVTEIAECLDSIPNSQTDIIALERQRRPVRQAGVFHGATAAEVLNDGKLMRTKFHTVLDEGTELTMWCRNESGAQLTTGQTIHAFGRIYGYWD